MKIEHNSRTIQHLRVTSLHVSLCSPAAVCIEKCHLSRMKSICTLRLPVVNRVRLTLYIYTALQNTFTYRQKSGYRIMSKIKAVVMLACMHQVWRYSVLFNLSFRCKSCVRSPTGCIKTAPPEAKIVLRPG